MKKKIIAIVLSLCCACSGILGNSLLVYATEDGMSTVETKVEENIETLVTELESVDTEETEIKEEIDETLGTEETDETKKSTRFKKAEKGELVIQDSAKWKEDSLSILASEDDILGLVYLADQYPVRGEADGSSAVVVTVFSGQTVFIKDYELNDENELWIFVQLEYDDVCYEGFVERSHLAISDERFLKWEQQMGFGENVTISEYDSGEAQGLYGANESSVPSDIAQFPESYQSALIALKNSHPNWTFVKQTTGFEWDTVVNKEMGYTTNSKGVKSYYSLTSSNAVYMRSGPADSTGWAPASKEALEYYLDPRNGLTESYIFEFELLTYNASYHTEAAVQTFLNSTFMKGVIPGENMTYAHAFYEIGKKLAISPTHLSSRVYQEQGQGTSPLISGTYSGYEGYYNYFNVKASGSSNEEIYKNGLTYAKQQGWNTRYKSLEGGASLLSKNYIGVGQDTRYLQKYNVSGNSHGLGGHQYMQNIAAAMSESISSKKIYTNSGSMEAVFVFKIPVYNNMPSQACKKPTAYGLEITIPSGYDTNVIQVDGVDVLANRKTKTWMVYLNNSSAKKAVAYKYQNGIKIECVEYTLKYNTSTCKYEIASAKTVDLSVAKMEGYSMYLAGDFRLNFYMTFAGNLQNRSDVGVKVIIGEKSYGFLASEYKEGDYYKFTIPISPYMINEVVEVQVYSESKLKGDFTYSVREYLNALLTGTTTSSSEKQLASAMIEYGEYVKDYFEYTEVKPVEDSVLKVSYTKKVSNSSVNCTFGEVAQKIYFTNDTHFIFEGASLVCKDTLALKLYFDNRTEMTVEQLKSHLSVKKEDGREISDKNIDVTEGENGRVCVCISNLSVLDLKQKYVLNIAFENIQAELSYSPYTYLKKGISNKTNSKLVNLCRAIYFYAEQSSMISNVGKEVLLK